MDNGAIFQSVGTKNRLVHRVVDEIEQMIASGQLAPGMKLPPEREFAETLGVSRTVVREAMHVLTAKGLLESRHGVGNIVLAMRHDALVEPLGWLMHAYGATLDDLHGVRSVLEIEIARLAAGQASDADIARLCAIVERMEQCREDVETFVALDADLHKALSETTHNPLLVALLDSVRDLMQDVRMWVHRHPTVYETVVPDHQAIVAAIAARDPDAAARAMQRHLDHSRAFHREFLDGQDVPPAHEHT
jgi:DNA-binding FadR family transcriptional regulator